jgi:hypothetical protein
VRLVQRAKDLEALPEDLDLNILNEGSSQVIEALRELAFRQALSNKVWFLENFWQVVDPEKMVHVPFKLRDYQLSDMEWIDQSMKERRERHIVGKARQIGLTTEITAAATHDMFANKNHPWVIASQTEDDAKETLLERIKEPYLMLPEWFKAMLASRAGVKDFLENDTTESMRFANGSRVLSVPSTSRAGRSKVVWGVILDEGAHMENAKEVFTAMDPMCYGPLYLISTGNGMGNYFHSTWVDSDMHDSEWHQHFHPWWVVPGRDQAWYEREKKKYRQEMWRFYQEYPASAEEMFAKTGMTIFPMELLREEQEFMDPVVKVDLDMHWQGFHEAESLEDLAPMAADGEGAANELWVWEPPMVERDPDKGYALRPPNYVIFADIAEGLTHNDRSSITVFNANTFEEAAAYRGWWPIEDLGELLNYLGRWYHNALIVPERNNQGILPIEQLRKDYEYPRLHRMGTLASIPTGDKTPRYGWSTNKATKPKMVHEFIKALRDGTILLHDVRFLEEAATFIRHDNGSFAASKGNYDDHVISHLGAWQGVLAVEHYPVVWRDDEGIRPVTWGEMMEWDDEEPLDPLSIPLGTEPASKPRKTWVMT